MNDISVKDFTFGYPDKPLFDKFNIDFSAGEFNVILGSSGVGKTTLLNAVTGLIKYEGEITSVPQKISYIFQKDRLIPSISVYKNLDLVLRTELKDKKIRKEKIENMLSLLEISDTAKRLPTEISGGQAQRVAMARAFLYPSELLILDEPFKGLDVSLKTRLITEFFKLWEKDKRTVIMVTHDVYEALLMADIVTVIAGSPVEKVYQTRIDIEKSTRLLTDAAITAYRDEIISKIL